jgi:tetratricopeptide (TPR) repeat protein
MKRIIIAVLLFSPLFSFGSDPVQLFNEANESYQRSEYKYAVELYEQVLSQGVVSPELYYNLGNAYFKSNMMGPAIINYERALRLRPMDEDIQHNLSVARTRIVDRIEQRPMLFYERWWLAAWTMQSLDGWAISSIVFIVLLLACTSLYLFSRVLGVKKASFFAMLLMLMLVLLSLIFTRKQYNSLNSEREAIIMQTRVTAKSSPSMQSPDLFLLHEGTKITIRNTLGEWLEISLPNGNVGWIKQETMEII